MSIDDSSEKEFAIRKSYRGDGKKRYETVLAVNIFIFILTSNHIKKSTQLLFFAQKSLHFHARDTRTPNLQKEQQTLLLLYNCSHVPCVILPRQRRASSVRISLVIVNEEEEQQQTVVVVSLFVVVVIDDAQKRSPIAPSLRKEKCIIYSEGTRSRTTIAAPNNAYKLLFRREERALARRSLAGRLPRVQQIT